MSTVHPLYLRLRAPFAAFRWMQAGVFRGTARVMPYSAAWGLVLNLAGVETRGDGTGPTTLVHPDAPTLRLALGTPAGHVSEVATLYQQLHGYPVGTSGKEFKERTHGAKYWIAPARRELLADFDMVLGVEADAALLGRVRDGLAGTLAAPRYGLPFAGDNNLLFDHIDCIEAPPPCDWYTPVREEETSPRVGSCRLTLGIDRSDSSRTTVLLVAPETTPSILPPAAAWVSTPRAPTVSESSRP